MGATAVSVLAYSLLTVDDLVAHAKLGATPTSDALTMANRIVNSVTLGIEGYCRRPFVARSKTERHDGTGTVSLYPYFKPIRSVTSLEQLDSTTAASLWTADVASDIEIDDDRGLVQLINGSVFGRGYRNWKIVYSPGWADLSSVPDDVVQAALVCASALWRRYDKVRDEEVSRTFEGQTIVFDNRLLTTSVRDLLDPWILYSGGSA